MEKADGNRKWLNNEHRHEDFLGRGFSKKTAETTAELAQDIISSISSIFTKTGELVKSINDETYGHAGITRHSETVSDLGSSLDEDTADALTDGYTMLQGKVKVLCYKLDKFRL